MTSRLFSYWLPSIVLGMALGQFILVPAEIANAQSSDQTTTEDEQAENADSASDGQTNSTANQSNQDQSNQVDNQNNTTNQPSTSNNAQQPAQPSGTATQQVPPVSQPATQNTPQATTLPAPAGVNTGNQTTPGTPGTTNQSPNSSLNQRPADQPANMREPQRDQASGFQQSAGVTNQPLDQQLGIEFEQSQTLQANPPTAQDNGLARNGLTIRTIQPQSVFFNSGLREGDVILSVDNRPVLNQAEFSRIVTTYQSQRIPLVVMRGGRQETIFLTRPQEFSVAQRQSGITSGQAVLGVTLDSRIPDAAIVSRVSPASPAEQAGILPGDIIMSINNQPIGTSHQLVQIIASMAPGQQVSLDITRQQSQFQVDAVLAHRSQPVRHSVGYAPLPGPPLERTFAPRVVDEVRPIRPGDADRDGRVLDGDGRLPRRIYRNW